MALPRETGAHPLAPSLGEGGAGYGEWAQGSSPPLPRGLLGLTFSACLAPCLHAWPNVAIRDTP